ncbi:hypothetical protein K2173_026245 [Erythroxylum novogranatense]|uniref:Pectinesterase inhibitor domain-containing protein n=1 Tax=Erythroxylum novogranatense TaxID=1862640 RepID=A0AAV8SC54_9ROSI|nr:hypothetical protein K2173_026245 [Erythroxylum novogranatense]
MYNPIPWFRSRNKLRICFLPMSMLFLASLISLASPLKTTSETPHLHVHKHLQIAHSTCQGTLYRDLCVSTLRSLPDLNTMSVTEFISATLNRTLRETRASSSSITSIRSKGSESLGQLEKVALKDCLDLLDSTIAELMSALSDLSHKKSVLKHYKHLQTLLSAAMTNQYTCLDGFAYSKGNVRDIIENSFLNISRHISNSLVMLKKVPGVNTSKYEASPEYHNTKQDFPTWLSSKDRKLLKDPANATKYNLIVAKDGTGNFTSISEAVATAPNSSATRFVIYIKSGSYFENVEVETKKTMIMFVGDGIGKTTVKASRNVVEGWTTFRSATVAVVGNGFIAKGITFENGAGPSKHQAVALRSGSDLSAFYKCSFLQSSRTAVYMLANLTRTKGIYSLPKVEMTLTRTPEYRS